MRHTVAMGVLTALLVLVFMNADASHCAVTAYGAPVQVTATINRHTEVSTNQTTVTVKSNVPLALNYTDINGGHHNLTLGVGSHEVRNVQTYELVRL